MDSGSLALLYFLLGFHGGRQGSSPDRGRSPVEWGDFPSVRLFPPLGHPAWPEAQPARSEAQPAKLQDSGLAVWASGHAGWPGGGNGQTDRQTNRKSLHSTGLCPLLGPLPCFPSCKPRKCLFKIKVKQGKGTADHLMPLGYLFVVCFCRVLRFA